MSEVKNEITKEIMEQWNQEKETYKKVSKRDEYYIFNMGGLNYETIFKISSI